jgi:hypothetical protein
MVIAKEYGLLTVSASAYRRKGYFSVGGANA